MNSGTDGVGMESSSVGSSLGVGVGVGVGVGAGVFWVWLIECGVSVSYCENHGYYRY